MAKLSPVFNDQTIDVNGDPASGYKLFTYVAGSSTKQPVYTDAAGTIAHLNPIILNTEGWPTQGAIWIPDGVSVKFVLALPTDTDPPTSPVKTIDNVTGVNDSGSTTSEWVVSGLTPTYINPASFSLQGDQTSDFHVGRRVKTLDGLGTDYGYINSSVFTSLTTVTVVLDAGALDSSLSQVSLGIITADNTSAPILKDSNFRVSGSSDKTKRVALEVDGLTASTTRTLTIQDKDGVLPVTSDFNVALNYTLAASVSLSALTISLKTASGADPSPGNPVYIPFRSGTLTSGTYNLRAVTAALSIIISSGSTLGTVAALLSQIDVIAIDNAGVVELAVVNHAGAPNLPETDFISTTAEGGAGAADSYNVIYSTTARASVPYHSLGYVQSTQATPGTWATAPSKLQLFSVPQNRTNVITGTAIPATSGTSLDVTLLPSWITHIEVTFSGLQQNGATNITLQLRDTATPRTTGYLGASTSLSAGGNVATNPTNGLALSVNTSSALILHGKATLDLIDASTNLWSMTTVNGQSNVATTNVGGSTKSLGAVLDGFRITTAGGVSTFTAGVINYLAW